MKSPTLGKSLALATGALVIGVVLGFAWKSWLTPDNSYYISAFDYSEPVPEYTEIRIASKVLGEERVINVALPPGYGDHAETRYPVLYMPDGGIGEDFPHMVYTVRQIGYDYYATNEPDEPWWMPDLIVVGIENTRRQRDLTGPTTVASDRTIADEVGRSHAFRDFIRDELIPEIESRFRCSSDRALIGESLAGLFVVETALMEPQLFSRYAAISPSLWWNDAALVKQAADTMFSIHEPSGVRLFLTAANETDIFPHVKQLDAELRLSKANLEWVFRPRMDLTHQTVFRAMKREALRWLYEE